MQFEIRKAFDSVRILNFFTNNYPYAITPLDSRLPLTTRQDELILLSIDFSCSDSYQY